MELRRKTFIELAGLASLGICTSRKAVANDLRVLRALSVPADAAKQVLYAQQANIFRNRGIDVQLSPMGSGAAIFAAIVGGSADVGTGSLFPVFTAYEHGIPLRIIAPIALYSSDFCDTWLLVLKNGPIRTPRDLNGKTMGADAPNDIYVTSTRVWMDQHGGDGNSLRPVELKATEQLTALNAGRVDVVVLKPPYLTVATQSGSVRVLGKPLDVIAPRFLVSAWVATADFVRAYPELIEAFVAGLARASRYTNAHQSETVDLVASFSGQDRMSVARGVRTITAESITLGDVQKPLDFAYRHGVIDRQFDARSVLSPSALMSTPR